MSDFSELAHAVEAAAGNGVKDWSKKPDTANKAIFTYAGMALNTAQEIGMVVKFTQLFGASPEETLAIIIDAVVEKIEFMNVLQSVLLVESFPSEAGTELLAALVDEKPEVLEQVRAYIAKIRAGDTE